MPSTRVKQIGRKTRSANMLHTDCPCTMAARAKASVPKRLTPAQKYQQLKSQTEAAGMSVREIDGKIVVKDT